jgi:rubredoxin
MRPEPYDVKMDRQAEKLALKDICDEQLRLKGVWLSPVEGCPHRRGHPEGPDTCTLEGHVCELELGKSCGLFREIIHEWVEEANIETKEPEKLTDFTCPECGRALEYFSGLETLPEYWYCPECNDWAYTMEGEKLARLV